MAHGVAPELLDKAMDDLLKEVQELLLKNQDILKADAKAAISRCFTGLRSSHPGQTRSEGLADSAENPPSLEARNSLAGFSAPELKSMGFALSELKSMGFAIAELKSADFSAAELRSAGFSDADLKSAGFSVDAKLGGFSAEVSSASELRSVGKAALSAELASFSVAKPRKADVAAALKVGFEEASNDLPGAASEPSDQPSPAPDKDPPNESDEDPEPSETRASPMTNMKSWTRSLVGTEEGGESPSKLKKKAMTKRIMGSVRLAPGSMSMLQSITGSRFYEYSSIAAIILNAFFIGYQTEFMADRALNDVQQGVELETDVPHGLIIMSVLFNLVFLFDLAARWAAEGFVDFWISQEFSWNLLDFLIVFVGCFDMFFQIQTLSGSDAPSMGSRFSVNRVLRVIRVVKVVRIIRVLKFFRELRMMVYSIMNSLISLLWVSLVLGLLFYIFGITFTAAATSTLDSTEKWQDPENGELVEYFGTLGRSFVSLYMSMSGGNDWAVYYFALDKTGPVYQLLFLAFVSFSIFAVVNIVTGVFVDSALTASQWDKSMIVQMEMDAKKKQLESLREVFEELDEDGNGLFDEDSFRAKLSNERVMAYFARLKLDVSDAGALFKLLDFDQSNEVSMDEFVSGIFRLQGEATNLDTKLMQYEVKYMKQAVSEIRELIREGVAISNEKAKAAAAKRSSRTGLTDAFGPVYTDPAPRGSVLPLSRASFFNL